MINNYLFSYNEKIIESCLSLPSSLPSFHFKNITQYIGKPKKICNIYREKKIKKIYNYIQLIQLFIVYVEC